MASQQSDDIKGGVWLAIIGLAIIIFLPPCIAFGLMDRRHAQQQHQIDHLKEENKACHDRLHELQHRIDTELRRIHHQPPLVPKKNSEQPTGEPP